MFVQILTSSAWTGVVWTIGGAERLEQPPGALAGGFADAADDARQRPDLGHEAVGGDPLRHVGDEDVLAGGEAALLLEVAGHEVRRAGRDRRAQDEQLAGPQERQQVVEHRADVAEVDLDVREHRRAEREHDGVRLRGVGGASRDVEVHARQHVLRAGLLEGHPARPDGLEPLGVLVDAEDAQPGVREHERERQPDPAEADDGDVVHGSGI